jgi:hypothetical protein
LSTIATSFSLFNIPFHEASRQAALTVNGHARYIFPLSALALLSTLLLGCSIHYFDAKTGTEHLWGVGHLKMTVHTSQDNSTTKALLVGVQTVGLRLDLAPNTRGISLGYDDTRTATIFDSDSPLKLSTNSGEPFTLQLGVPPPWTSGTH